MALLEGLLMQLDPFLHMVHQRAPVSVKSHARLGLQRTQFLIRELVSVFAVLSNR